MFAPAIAEISGDFPPSHHRRRPGKDRNDETTVFPNRKSAATPLWLPIPDHDHDGDKPEGRLAKEEDDDRPDTDIPLHSASPWPKRALKSPRRTLPTFFLP